MAIKEGRARIEIYLKNRFSDPLDVEDTGEEGFQHILVPSDGYNKIPSTEWLINKRN